jgi:hypothetical protein
VENRLIPAPTEVTMTNFESSPAAAPGDADSATGRLLAGAVAPVDAGTWIRAIAVALGSSQFTPRLHTTRSGLDLTVVAQRDGRRSAECILDEAGYAELRWWIDLATPAADVAAQISRIVTAVSPPASASSPEATQP